VPRKLAWSRGFIIFVALCEYVSMVMLAHDCTVYKLCVETSRARLSPRLGHRTDGGLASFSHQTGYRESTVAALSAIM